MKCLRCGKIVSDELKECPYCSFNLQEQKSYKKIKIETDDNIDPKDKVVSIDSPILTFVFGIFALMCGLTLLANRLPIPLIVVFLFFICFSASFYFSIKPTRVKMKPVRTVGVIMAFIGLALTCYSLVFALLVLSGIL